MKKLFTILLIICCSLPFGCQTSRFIYVAEEPISLYEFPSFKGSPILVAEVGDTVVTTGLKTVGLGGAVPVEFNGYRFYSPSAKARLIRRAKVNLKNSAAIPAVVYVSRMRQEAEEARASEPVMVDETIDWYGRVTTAAPVLDEPSAIANTVTNIPRDAVVKIKRHSYDYWQVSVNGRVGYVGTFYIMDHSKSDRPFVKTAYTGPTYYPADERAIRPGYTPSTGAYIHTGPRGGRFYYNSKGNKTYVPRSSSYYRSYRSPSYRSYSRGKR